MKIAIATNDRITIAERTGKAKEFLISEINDFILLNSNYIVNTHTHHNHTEKNQEHSHPEIIEALEGVDLFIVKRVGKHLRTELETGGIQYKITSETSIKNILAEYLTLKT